MQGFGAPSTAGAARLPVEAENKLQNDVNAEYHDPYDDWSVRDILVSLVPFVVVFALRDVGLRGALAFALVWAWFVLLYRVIATDSRRKKVWPLLDIIGALAFPILLGLTYIGPGAYGALFQWMPVILPAIFGFAVLLSIVWRRPFTAHYARYPKFDRGGAGVWEGDASYRSTSDYASIGWLGAFTVMCLLALIPVMTGWFTGYVALNIIFNYIVPGILLVLALAVHQIMGVWYRRSTTSRAGAALTEQPGYPAGVEGGERAEGAATQETSYASTV